MKMGRKTTAFLLGVLIVLMLPACSATTEKRYEASFLELFDTASVIVGYAKSEDEFAKYSQKVYDELEVYNKLFDIYNDYDGINNIKTINDNAGIKAVKVDKKIIDLLSFSREMYEETDGKVNIAFGAVLSLWHDHRTAGLDDPEKATLPAYEELEARNQHIDIEHMVIDEEASTVYLQDPEMSLDVGAIAKGYAVEKVAQFIQKEGLKDGMVSVGGNVKTFGNKYDEKGKKVPWTVGIQNPDLSSDQKSLYNLGLSGYSLVTSGVYERYYTVDGKQYHHIIDPETLMPAEYFLSVSIICEDSGMADALSTAVFNIPYEEGSKMVEGLDGVETLWVFSDHTMKYSSGFEKWCNYDKEK
ncbi:thiamine biosynthesis lipoprotein [Faecalicatena contorta]|uniref:FAD:protein FMN transferase n=2 Tax=Faecalicatena contorta TaxID=39482 RepID=A0A316A6E2_9FIRM|nr:thiamine biosynthesis lipoprotein [Faecalicatena contorta]SUQ12652.1 thiamine biosynthesis lipoprotein [Faecalicatena contorta]